MTSSREAPSDADATGKSDAWPWPDSLDAVVSVPSAWPWPDSLDAVTAAPKWHNVLLENEHVRVVETIIEAGEKEPAHTHGWRGVVIPVRPARIRYYDENDTLIFETRRDFQPPPNPIARWREPEGLHSVENVDNRPHHVIRIELKPQAKPAA